MKKNTIKIALFIALLSMGGYSVNAQNKELKIGTNPTIKQPSAVLEVESTNKGVLMPRVTLTSITDITTIAMPANALTVFNTATAGTAPNDVTPGYYYWSTAESKWIRLLNQNDVTEPWQIQGTTTKATSNAENIYQTGSVAIGKNAVQVGAALDVEGAVRGGSEHLGTVGENSVAFGVRNTASNFYTSIGGGANNIASGTSAVISGGNDNTASGGTAVVSGGSNNTASELGATVSGGQANTASAQEATVSGGHQNVASGNYSTVSGGLENYARSFGEWAGGLRTTDYTPYSAVSYDNRDRLFNIGNGIGVGRDAFTILKNGKTSIGFNNFETTTFGELLQVNGNARFATLPSETGNIATDRVVVADADGVLKTVTSDNLTIEPWQVQSTTDKATTNAQNIYQTGSVAIGKNEAKTGAALDVVGAVRGGVDQLFGVTAGPVGDNSVAFGSRNTASGSYSVAMGDSNEATAQGSTAFGAGNKASGYASFVINESNEAIGYRSFAGGIMSKAGGEGSFAFGASADASGQFSVALGGSYNSASSYSELAMGLNNTTYTPLSTWYWEAKDRLFNIGNGSDNSVKSDAFTILKNGKTGIGFNNFETTTFGELLQVNGNARFATLPSETGNIATDRVVVADADGVLKTVTAPTTTAIRTESANYAAATTDETILVNAAGGTVTVTLPAVPTVGKKYNVKKIDATANTVNVSGNGHNIDGNATVSGTLPYQGWVMQYDGTNWFIISRI